MRELCDRFFRALTVCTGTSGIKKRLEHAWVEQLDEVEPASLPSSVRDDFELLRDAMYAETTVSGEHAARASVRKMSPQQAAQCAELIAVMYRDLMAAHIVARHAESASSASGEQSMAFELVDTHRLN